MWPFRGHHASTCWSEKAVLHRPPESNAVGAGMNKVAKKSHSGRGLPEEGSEPAVDVEPRMSQDGFVFTAAHRNAGQPVRRITSAELFGNNQEIEIEHGGSCYRLRQTALGKLIMTK